VGGELLTAYGTPDKSAVVTLANGAAKILFKPNDDVDQAIIEIRSQTNNGVYLKLDGVPDVAVVYKTIGDLSLKLHIFNPEGLKLSDKRPAMVFFHGGGWSGGEPSKLYPQAEYLASRGMVAISAEYRVRKRNDSTPRESVMDAKSAIRWVRAHAGEFGIDPEKILAGGGSAGGHLAAATGTLTGFNEDSDNLLVSERPAALVLFNPVYDNSSKGYGHDRVKEYWQEISPMHNLSAKTPPTIVFLGTQDKHIPVATAEKYKMLMEEKGVRSDLHIYAGQKHGFFNYSHKEHYEKTTAEMDEFLVSLGYLEFQ
jgi:acetyl esterase